MVCALHRLFQSESDDRVMEHGFDPGPEHPPSLQGEQGSQGREARGRSKAGILGRLAQTFLRRGRKPSRPAGS